MKSTKDFASEVLQYSLLILWSDEKQKWQVEWSLLKIRFYADTYEEALTELCRTILKSNISKEFHEAIEKYKVDFLNSDT
jgi:hypothetical protein